MPGPNPPAVVLTSKERDALERLVRAHTTGQTLVLRARIVLAAADGRNNAQIERSVGRDVETASIWRRRWLQDRDVPLAELKVAERLADAPRPGAVPRITAQHIQRTVASDPTTTRWHWWWTT